MSPRLEVGPDVAAVLRPEEAARLHELRDLERMPCAVCDEWVDPGSNDAASVSISVDGATPTVEFAHATCRPSRADLARLVAIAQAEPQGIAYVQALHPDAGAVLLWERKLDLRVRGPERGETCLYLDADWWHGFHQALPDEPVRLLNGWWLRSDGEDLVLRRGEEVVERFHDAGAYAPAGWLEALQESGFCLLIVGAQLELERPGTAAIQRAIRAGRALIGLIEFDEG